MSSIDTLRGPATQSGAQLLSCELDDNCPSLDCDAVLDEYDEALMEAPEGSDFVAHYCGLRYLERLPPATDDE